MYKRGDFLKIIALVTMLIDHIGFLLYPHQVIFRIIGRISFPIFCLLLARGFRRTSNRKKYALRMLIFAFISQVPYHFFSPNDLNIFFSLFAGILIIWMYESKSPISAFLLPLIAFFTPLQYGMYGLYMMLIFYVFKEKKSRCIPALLLINAIHFVIFKNIIQLWSLLVIIPIVFEIDIDFRVPKWFSYIFYPAHITILLMISHYFY